MNIQINENRSIKAIFILLIIFTCASFTSHAQQTAYFVDGYHGGIWGHYPESYTAYIVDELEKNPEWKINLEIEPDTWDRASKIDAASVEKLKGYFAQNRVEYVNPAYGQPYMWNISGESIIKQFELGMEKLKHYFPDITFTSYSSEEPCFTSGLPQILFSFGFKYASLKNPNTCWGGYTRAHDGELVNWVGSDGTSIIMSPRYSFESLKPNSTWETIANANSHEYINAALQNDFTAPIGMCLQDAGWKNGPWLKGGFYKPTEYTTWTNYFDHASQTADIKPWHVNQEDLQVSLVWGSQVMQRIAQQEREAANKIILAEKITAINSLYDNTSYPETDFKNAWSTLLLTQHHDCWIVPYNGEKGDTWADKVVNWTKNTMDISNANIQQKATADGKFIRVYNTSGTVREELIQVKIPQNSTIETLDGKAVMSQKNGDFTTFMASAPAMGYSVYKIVSGGDNLATAKKGITRSNNIYKVETENYTLSFDAAQGGKITSIIAKKADNKEFVDADSQYGFNTLQGNFYDDGGKKTTVDKTAEIEILENGPLVYKLAIKTSIADVPVTQTVTLYNENPVIDFDLKIDWSENMGIGAFKEENFDWKNPEKAFYNDREKLLSLFPVNLKNQRVFKNSAFDVMESGLDNTFFTSWKDIKNNIIADWVDVTDGDEKYGMTLFTDHTTSYTHGKDFPLGLTIQYSGIGLWGRDYTVDGPTEIHYSLMPHKGNWKQAQIWKYLQTKQEPLTAVITGLSPKENNKSLFALKKEGWVLTSFSKKENAYYARIFNPEGDDKKGSIQFTKDIKSIALVNLNGSIENQLKSNDKNVSFSIPNMGFKTLRIEFN